MNTKLNAQNNLPMVMNKQSGFTLIEIMVVMVILGVLAMIVVPNVVGQSDKARVQTTQTTLNQVAQGLAGYRMDNGRYPTTTQGIDALLTPPADAKNYPNGGYLGGDKYPTDSWDNELQYRAESQTNRDYDLYSLGADGKEGGEGLDADIYADPK